MIDPSQKPLADNIQYSQERDTTTAGFEPTVPTSERLQTHALDRAATGNGDQFLQKPISYPETAESILNLQNQFI